MTIAKLEEYKAPWEIDSTTKVDVPDDEQVVDKALLKKYLHGLLSDKDRLQTTVASVTGERDNLKTELDVKAREGETDPAKATREHDDAVKAARAEGGLASLKLEVALDVEGITPAQAKRLAKRLTGNTLEELEADAKSLAEDFNIAAKPAVEDADDDAEQTPAGRPRRVSSSNDRTPVSTGLPKLDSASVNEAFPRR